MIEFYICEDRDGGIKNKDGGKGRKRGKRGEEEEIFWGGWKI